MTYYSLHDIVSSLQLYSDNPDRLGYVRLRNIAKEVWWDLAQHTREIVTREWVKVANGVISVPKCLEELLSVLQVDHCGDLQALYTDNQKNIFPKEFAETKCDCGGKTYEDFPTTETVEIEGEPYIKKTITRIQGNDIYKYEEMPVADYNAAGEFSGVVYDTTEYKVCSVDANQCGCIPATPENEKKLCECGFRCEPSERVFFGVSPNKQGYYKYDYNTKKIHVFDCHGKPSTVDSALIVYMGKSDNMLIPQYAKQAVLTGVESMQMAFNPIYSDSERKGAERRANRQKFEMLVYLHPFNTEFTI